MAHTLTYLCSRTRFVKWFDGSEQIGRPDGAGSIDPVPLLSAKWAKLWQDKPCLDVPRNRSWDRHDLRGAGSSASRFEADR